MSARPLDLIAAARQRLAVQRHWRAVAPFTGILACRLIMQTPGWAANHAASASRIDWALAMGSMEPTLAVLSRGSRR